MAGRSGRAEGFDGAAAVTRSLLGYGVLAGVFYLVVGLVLALTRDGFRFSQHPLSILMLGDGGWMQRGNLALTGLMVLAAAVGFARAMRGASAARWAGVLLGIYGVALLLGAVFPPDPMDGFPAGAVAGDPTLSGILHMAFGGVGFLALAAAAVVVGGWFAARNLPGPSRWSRVAAGVVVVAFMAGAALATQPIGIALLWLAVVAGWVWLAAASVCAYRTVPHPDAHRREATDVDPLVPGT
jgi:hypothetical protein